MAGASATSIKTYIAGGAITRRRIVRHGTADGTALLGNGVATTPLGVSTEIDVVSGEPVDVIREGLADVEYGGTVTRGDPLTSDATGRAVTAAPATGVNNRCIGWAEVSGVVGDIGTTSVAPFIMQG